jgi:hypothetical protein
LQPDIPEEDELELELDDAMFEVVAKFDYKDDMSVYDGVELPYEPEKKAKRLGWLWVCGLIFCTMIFPHFCLTAPIFINHSQMLWPSNCCCKKCWTQR